LRAHATLTNGEGTYFNLATLIRPASSVANHGLFGPVSPTATHREIEAHASALTAAGSFVARQRRPNAAVVTA
jgi:hypothetical protein